ncbi:putative LOC107374655-like protein, partial [Nothobranchius furzeri]
LGLQQRIDKFDENRLLKALATNCVIDSLCRTTLPKAYLCCSKTKGIIIYY